MPPVDSGIFFKAGKYMLIRYKGWCDDCLFTRASHILGESWIDRCGWRRLLDPDDDYQEGLFSCNVAEYRMAFLSSFKKTDRWRDERNARQRKKRQKKLCCLRLTQPAPLAFLALFRIFLP